MTVLTIFSALLLGPIVSGERVPKDPSVCVVGGGLTGLAIANKLKKAGIDVVLFEKRSDHIGGKLGTEDSWDIGWEKGTVFYNPGDPINTFIQDCQMNRTAYLGRPKGENVAYIMGTSTLIDPPNILAEYREEWKPLLQKYSELRSRYSVIWLSPGGFEVASADSQVPPDLLLPGDEWLKRAGLEDIKELFEMIFPYSGYGLLKDLPALYMLKRMTPELLFTVYDLKTSPGGDFGLYTPAEGFSYLAYCLARKLDFVLMGYDLLYLNPNNDRFPGRVTLFFKVGQGSTKTTVGYCKKVILAFPPLLGKVLPIFGDLTEPYKRLFGSIKVHKFFSSGHIIKQNLGGWRLLFFNRVRDGADLSSLGNGLPIQMIQSKRGQNMRDAYTMYSWLYGKYDQGPAQSDIAYVDGLQRTWLRNFNDAPPKLSFFQGYDFFPHVSARDLKDGFLANFSRIQGTSNVYFATTATSVESTTGAIEVADSMVARIRILRDM